MATTPTFYPYSPEPHRGIAQSLPVAQDVIKLAIDADEARAWFFETHACQRLRELFPAAITFLIEDDYRQDLPEAIRKTAAEGTEWIINGSGRSRYQFKQVKLSRIVPREELVTIKVPDATPEIIAAYALGDEQALLAKVRYNRLVDIFLGITAYSLQNHLRTTVKGIGQIEIDEIYVGLDRHGRQFVVPVQAKGGSDKHGVVQTQQDIACCREKFKALTCRPVSAQFMSNGRIAMFELTVENDEVKVVDEKHYQLVHATDISIEDLQNYAARSD